MSWTAWRPRSQLCLRYTADGSPLRNDMKISMQSFATERINRGGDRMVPLGIRMTAGIQLAEGAGHMELQSTDPYQQPFLDYNYLQEESDRVRLRDSVRLCLQLAEHPQFASIIQERTEPPADATESDAALDAWIAREVTTSQHISGTCKMGPRQRPHGRSRPVRQSKRHPKPARSRRQHNARLHPRQHQRIINDHRRTRRRIHHGRTVASPLAIDCQRPPAYTTPEAVIPM